MDSMDAWTWPTRPATATEFEAMMSDLDRHLATHNLLPAQRSLNAARLASMALKLSGTSILSGDGDRGEPFSPRDLLARVIDWYNRVMQAYDRGYVAMATLDELKGHDLFDQARGDYTHSVEALAAGLVLSKARWDTAQCAEKVFKGLLGRAGQPFPTNAAQGHDIVHLGDLVMKHFGIALPDGALRAIHCSPKVRYGEMNVDPNEAWTSHDALLDVLARLRPIALPVDGKRLRR